MQTPRWVIACLVVAPIGFVIGVLTIVLFHSEIAFTCGMALAFGSFNIGAIALNRLDRITKARRAQSESTR